MPACGCHACHRDSRPSVLYDLKAYMECVLFRWLENTAESFDLISNYGLGPSIFGSTRYRRAALNMYGIPTD